VTTLNQLPSPVKSPLILRVFPRRTNATPDDKNVRIAVGPGFFDVADEIHVSVVFTWDIPFAEHLAYQWQSVAPVKLGGPAYGSAGGDFVSGMYLKSGYVITSRGCNNRCWFCSVWKREGNTRTLPIVNGRNVLDDNLLACPDDHIRQVFSMLRQSRSVEFTGGLEAKLLKQWHVDELRTIKPKQIFFAYDTPDDLEPLRTAGKMLLDSGFKTSSHVLRCYVLCGFPQDTFSAAEKRIRESIACGFFPMAMLYRDQSGERCPHWQKWQRQWCRPSLIAVNS
jgi:hypothetical protein